jgi:hypothetical protein
MQVSLKYFLILPLIFACTKIIDVDSVDPNAKIVVSSIFYSEELWDVKVTNSIGHGGNGRINTIENAMVNILDKNSNLIETLRLKTESFPGVPTYSYYRTRNNNKPIEGESYKIEVSAPGYETVFAESNIPNHTDIVSFNKTSSTDIEGNMKRSATIQFLDRSGVKDYYVISLTQYNYKIDTNPSSIIDTSYLSKSESLLTSYSLEVEAPRINRDVLYISDKSFNGDLHSISFNYKLVDDSSINGNLYRTVVSMSALSEAAFEFYTTLNKHEDQLNNPFSEPVRIYSNIENGLGIFGGLSFASKEIFSKKK